MKGVDDLIEVAIGVEKKWIISNLVKKKTGFFLKRIYFQLVLRIEKIPYGQMAPCPGKKAFASPKKAVIPFFPMRASAVSAQVSLSPRVSLRKQEGELGRVLPALFVFGACFLARATRRRV